MFRAAGLSGDALDVAIVRALPDALAEALLGGVGGTIH